MTTTINNLPFGIELETTIPSSDTTPVGGRHCGISVNWLAPFVGSFWKAEQDGSINPPMGRKGVEFVSPKLAGIDGLRNAKEAAQAIVTRGGKVNASCGMHVTVTWNGDSAALARLLCLVSNFEKGLFASTGTTSRENGCWCKGIKRYGEAKHANDRARSDRYHMVNLTHLANGANRIEFRIFAGTLNATKIAAYVSLVLGMVELALESKKATKWDQNRKGGKCHWDREGAGAGEVEALRMLYKLGWLKGHSKKVYGIVDGVTDAEVKQMREEIIRLAKQYDGRIAAEQN